jgi:hypothetical protein
MAGGAYGARGGSIGGLKSVCLEMGQNDGGESADGVTTWESWTTQSSLLRREGSVLSSLSGSLLSFCLRWFRGIVRVLEKHRSVKGQAHLSSGVPMAAPTTAESCPHNDRHFQQDFKR